LASGDAIGGGTYLNLRPLVTLDARFRSGVSDNRSLSRMFTREDLAIAKRCIYQRKCSMQIANEEVRNDAGERDSEQRSNSDETERMMPELGSRRFVVSPCSSNMRRRHSSHRWPSSEARTAVKGAQHLRVHRSEAETLDGRRSGGYAFREPRPRPLLSVFTP
jgi:hypothetical protein